MAVLLSASATVEDVNLRNYTGEAQVILCLSTQKIVIVHCFIPMNVIAVTAAIRLPTPICKKYKGSRKHT